MTEEMKKFVKLVKQMRDAQTAAKKSHTRSDNTRAEGIERMVDAKLTALLKQTDEEAAKAVALFQG